MKPQHKNFLIIALILSGIILLISIFRVAPDTTGASSAAITPDKQSAAEKEGLKEILPANQVVSDGDVQGLNHMLKSNYGLEVKEIRKNSDGTYDAVFTGGSEVHMKQASVYTEPEQKEYTRELMAAFNEGKKVEVTAKDREEIAKFRRGVLGQ